MARKLSIGYAVAEFVRVPVAALLGYIYVWGPMMDNAGSAPGADDGRDDGRDDGNRPVVRPDHPVFLLIFMLRPIMRQACAGQWVPPPWQHPYMPPPLPPQ